MRARLIATPNRLRALGIGGVVALSLHAFVFSYLHMRELREKEPPRLQSRDNTPELLQFASQEGQTEPSKNAMSPRSPVLPPPANVTSSRRSPTTREHRSATPGRPPSGPLGRGGRPSATHLRITDAESVSGLSGPRSQGSGTPATTPAKSTNMWTSAVEHLRAMGSQERAAREGATAALTIPTSSPLMLTTEGKGLVRLDKESSLGRAYLELWSKATPYKSLTPNEAGDMTSTVEIRRVPWRNIRASELPIRHGQVIVLGERLLLFWLQDDALHLLQTSKMQREDAS